MNEPGTVFVVTYCEIKIVKDHRWLVADTNWENSPDKKYEPIVTVFDNRENAEKMYNYMISQGNRAWIDECPLYKKFLTSEECVKHAREECEKHD